MSEHTPRNLKITGKTGDGKRMFIESEGDNWECCRIEIDSSFGSHHQIR